MAKKRIAYGILYTKTEDDEFYNFIPSCSVKGELKKVRRDIIVDGQWVNEEVDAFFVYDKNGKLIEEPGLLPIKYFTEETYMCVDYIYTQRKLIEKYNIIEEEALKNAFFADYKDCVICKSKDNIDYDQDEEESTFTFEKDWLLENPNKITLSHLQDAWDSAFETIFDSESIDNINYLYDYLIDILESMGSYIVLCDKMKEEEIKSLTDKGEKLIERLKYNKGYTEDYDEAHKLANDLKNELKDDFNLLAAKTVEVISYLKEVEKEKKENTTIVPYKDVDEVIGINKTTQKKEIIEKLDSVVMGHDEAKSSLISIIENNDSLTEKSYINAVLLIGPSGCGKTLLVETLSKVMDKPFSLVNTLALTPAGYKGEDIEKVICLKLLRSAKGDIKKAERGVVYFDEFDKKAVPVDEDSKFDKKAIDQLLTFMSGIKCSVDYNGKIVELDTSFITFIAGGSFVDMIKAMQEEKNDSDKAYHRTTVGFIKENVKKQTNIDEFDLEYPKVLKNEDFTKYGKIRPETINRFPTFLILQGASRKILKETLLYSKLSPLLFEEQRIKAKGSKLAVLEEFVDPFVDACFLRKQCGRSLKNGLFQITSHITNILDEYPGRFKYVVLNKECVSDEREALLIDYENNRYTARELEEEIKNAKENKPKEQVVKTYTFIPEN